MADLISDIRYGIRMLEKTRLLSFIAVLVIGLGVALPTQTFSVIYGGMLRGLPVPDADRLVYIDQNRLSAGVESKDVMIHDFVELQQHQTSFEDIAVYYSATVNMASEGDLPERAAGAFVGANALALLGVEPLLGRSFEPSEEGTGAAGVIVLGYGVWQNRFGGDASILGESVRANGAPVTVIGVMPEGFAFPFNEDVWLPHGIDAATLPRALDAPELHVFGRLQQGVDLPRARADLDAIASRLEEQFPETNEGVGFGVDYYEMYFIPREIRAVMWVMFLATFGVLAIACANVANLLLARASLRTREVALRGALGASRSRILRQFLGEALALAAVGGGIGVGLSILGVRLYSGFTAGIVKPYWVVAEIDIPVLFFALATTAIASVLAGVVPAVRASGLNVGEVLKDQGRGSTSLRMGRATSALVVTEIAVSCALLVGAGFMVKSMVNVGQVELGFSPANVVTARVSLPEAEYPTALDRDQFFVRLRERLESEPGVVSATLTSHLPALGSATSYFAVEGEAYATDLDYPIGRFSNVSERYFDTFGVGFAEGRDFDPLEARVGGSPVAIVSQSFGRERLGGGSALGRRVRLGTSSTDDPWMTIVGVVPDMHVGGGVGGLGDDRLSRERIYVPRGLSEGTTYSMAALVEGAPEAVLTRLRRIVAELDPNLPAYDVALLDQAIEQATWAFTLFGAQFSLFGILGLFLAAVGLYGVLAFSVGQRRQEMGTRIALGAPARSVMTLVLARGARQLGIGLAVGLALGSALGWSMQGVLFGVDPLDLSIYAGIILVLVITGAFACILPARSAARSDPMEAMRP